MYVKMKNIGTDEEKNGNSIFIIDSRRDIENRQNEQPASDRFNLQSKEINVDLQHTTLPMENMVKTSNSSPYINPRLVDTTYFEQNLPITSPIKVVQEQSDFLIEYAQEPLLPLVQACVPLSDSIYNLSVYVRLVLDQTPREPDDKLTVDESAAIRLYTMKWKKPHLSLHSMLNFTLTKCDRHALRPYYKYLKLLLTALLKLPCAPLQTIWLGMAKDLCKDFPCGTKVTWWTFSSCTPSLMALVDKMSLNNVGERTFFSIEAINGRMIRAHSYFDYEDELLLLPGTYMEVQSQLSPAPDLHIIHMKQIKPMKTLLALPFEGAILYPPEKKKVLWYKKKRTIVELTLLISICLLGIIVGSVWGTRRSPSPPSSSPLSSPSAVCRTRTAGINADLFWSFDCGDAREDLKGLYNGTDENGVSYSSPDFSGQGKALNLNRALNQYVHLPRSLNLGVKTSFTVSMWIFSTGYNRATILSDCSAVNSVCIELYLDSVNVCAKTYNWNNENVVHSVVYNAWRVNYQSCWTHLAFSFDNQSNILSIYLNGNRSAYGYFAPSAFVVAKTNPSMTSYIGSASVPTNRYPFDGLIDQLSISYYVKNGSEILDEATLLCRYNFETDDINVDSGPNNIEAYSENVRRSLSNNQSDLLFNSGDSYFQSSGFTLLLSKSYEFTIAFWIRPVIMKSYKVNSAIPLLQVTSKVQQAYSESYVCFLSVLIANSTTDHPYFWLDFGQLNMYLPLNRYIVKNNTWTHIGISYSNSSYLNIYLDGQLHASLHDSRFSLLLYNPRLALTIGGNYFDDMTAVKPTKYASRKCFASNPGFSLTQMSGEIDDVKVFARALMNSEFTVLASSRSKSTS